jgi:hypothetical protein
MPTCARRDPSGYFYSYLRVDVLLGGGGLEALVDHLRKLVNGNSVLRHMYSSITEVRGCQYATFVTAGASWQAYRVTSSAWQRETGEL